MEINTKQIRKKLEISKLQQMFNEVQVTDDTVIVSDFEEDHSYAAIFMWCFEEDRAYSEDLNCEFARNDDADNITCASDFAQWVNSFY